MAFYATILFLVFSLIALSDEITITRKNKYIGNIGNGGITAELINGDSPLSPFYDPSLTPFDRVRNSLRHSLARQSIRSNPNSSLLTSSPPDASLTPTSGYYLMKVGIGNPPVDHMGIADTGSDLTWMQCAPCYNCFKQKTPVFDPKNSNTYGAVSCKSQQCQTLRLENPSCDNTTNNCRYEIYYGGDAHSYGDLATDTFTFNQNLAFPKIAFGCGNDNVGENLESFTGIIGLGGGPVSIIRQLKQLYSIDAKISYCLPSRDSTVSGTINFGANAVVSGPNVKSTPLVKKTTDTFHYVTLLGFSIGNKKLELINSGEYSSKAKVIEGNIFIDTGSRYTFLSKSFYAEFITALKEAVNGIRTADPRGDFKLCYEKPVNGKFDSPTITAHFGGGVDLVLAAEGTFLEVEKGVVCLTILPASADFLVFGNLQQLNYFIGIDLENQKVDFLPATSDCKIA